MTSQLADRFELTPGVDTTPSSSLDDTFEWATLLERLDSLRRGIVVALLSLTASFVICFTASNHIVRFILAPIRAALTPGAELVATRVTENFFVHVQASLLVAIVSVFPFWLYQLWRLLSSLVPGRRAVEFAPVAFIGLTLFGVGAAFGHYVLFPKAVGFLTSFGSRSVHVMLSIGTLFSFYSQFVLGIGAAFQVPTVVYVLSQLGLVTPALLVRVWQYVVLGVFTFAAIITPTPDIVTQSLLAVPMLVLYVLSIGLCWLVRRRRRHDQRT